MMDARTLYFCVGALLSILGGVGLIFVRRIIYCCLCLLASLLGVAALYVSLGVEFIAVLQILVYVGGVIILVLFAAMLMGGADERVLPKIADDQIPLLGNVKSHVKSVVLVLPLIGILVKAYWSSRSLFMLTDLQGVFSVRSFGYAMLTDYLFAFEVASVLLLGVLIAALVLARPQSKEER